MGCDGTSSQVGHARPGLPIGWPSVQAISGPSWEVGHARPAILSGYAVSEKRLNQGCSRTTLALESHSSNCHFARIIAWSSNCCFALVWRDTIPLASTCKGGSSRQREAVCKNFSNLPGREGACACLPVTPRDRRKTAVRGWVLPRACLHTAQPLGTQDGESERVVGVLTANFQ